jgi:hypothetical protein
VVTSPRGKEELTLASITFGDLLCAGLVDAHLTGFHHLLRDASQDQIADFSPDITSLTLRDDKPYSLQIFDDFAGGSHDPLDIDRHEIFPPGLNFVAHGSFLSSAHCDEVLDLFFIIDMPVNCALLQVAGPTFERGILEQKTISVPSPHWWTTLLQPSTWLPTVAGSTSAGCSGPIQTQHNLQSAECKFEDQKDRLTTRNQVVE